MMHVILFISLLFSLIHNGQSYRIVPKHIESGPVHSLKVFFSTQTNYETRTVFSTVTQTQFHTCYTTEPEIAECQKKRELDETNENEDLIILSDPKVEVNGVAANWENIISPSRVARNLEENVEEVYPTDVQVVQPAQREQAAVVYPSTVVENESVVKSRHHDEDQEIVVDNADEHVDDEVDLDEEATTISANKHLVYSDTAGSDETTTMENLEEEEIETTTVVVEADAAREAPEVSDSLDEQWELKEIALKMNGRSTDTCFDTNDNGGLFFTIFSTIYTTITEYQTEMETETNTVLFKSSGGCVPTDVHEMFTATCS